MLLGADFSDMHGLEYKSDKKGGPLQALTCIFANLNVFFSNLYLQILLTIIF